MAELTDHERKLLDALSGRTLTLGGVMREFPGRTRTQLIKDLNDLHKANRVERGTRYIKRRSYTTYTATAPGLPPLRRDGSMRPQEVARVVSRISLRYGDIYARLVLDEFNRYRQQRGIREVEWDNIILERGFQVARKL